MHLLLGNKADDHGFLGNCKEHVVQQSQHSYNLAQTMTFWKHMGTTSKPLSASITAVLQTQ